MSADALILVLFFLLPLFLFLALILGGGFAIWHVLKRRVSNVGRSLGGLAGVVNGTVESGSLLPRARLVGTHKGMPIEVKLCMNRQGFARGPGRYGTVYVSADDLGRGGYIYELSITTSSGGGSTDWRAVRGVKGEAYWDTGRGLVEEDLIGPPPQEDGGGEAPWRVKTDDEALERRLAGFGALAALRGLPGYPSMAKYTAGSLRYRSRLDSLDAVPDPDRFGAQLDAFADLAEINRRANAG